MRFWKEVVMVGVASLFWAAPIFVYAESCDDTSMEAGCTAEPSGYYDGYDDSQAHPLRIVGIRSSSCGICFRMVAHPTNSRDRVPTRAAPSVWTPVASLGLLLWNATTDHTSTSTSASTGYEYCRC